MTLLDLAAVLVFVLYTWGRLALSYRMAWTITNFIFDEIDFHFDGKHLHGN